MGKALAIQSDNKTLTDVADRTGMSKGYISFEEGYGAIYSDLTDMECHKHVNSEDYFDILRGLGFLIRGKSFKTRESEVFYKEREHKDFKVYKWLPPVKTIEELQKLEKHEEGDFLVSGMYMTKRGNFGLNVLEPEYENMLVPQVKAKLCELNKSISESIARRNESIKDQIEANDENIEMDAMIRRILKNQMIPDESYYIKEAQEKFYKGIYKSLRKEERDFNLLKGYTEQFIAGEITKKELKKLTKKLKNK